MRLREISLRGCTRFTAAEPIRVDFDSFGPGLIAVVGRNGEGKTTLLEAVSGALFKSFPSRPGWYESFHGRDAFIEALFDDRARTLKVRVQVDAETRKTESYLFEDGRSLTTGRAAEFDAEIARRFGSEGLFLSSVFAAQNKSGSFLLLPKTERKALFVELLGLSYLEALHGAAKEQHGTADAELTRGRARVEAHQGELAALPELEKKQYAAQLVADGKAHALEGARTEEAAAVSLLERARSAGAQLAALENAAAAAGRTAAAAQQALMAAEALAPKARRQAESRLKAVEARRPEDLERRARERHTATLAVLNQRQASLEKTLQQAGRVAEARAMIVGLEAERGDLETAEKAAGQADADHRLAGEKLAAADRRLEDARAAANRERERLQRQAAALDAAPCATQQAWFPPEGEAEDLAATCPLLAQAREARQAIAAGLALDPQLLGEAKDLRARLEAATQVRDEAMAKADPVRLHEVRQTLGELQALVDQTAPLIERAHQDLKGLAGERGRADRALGGDLAEARATQEQAVQERAQIDRELTDTLLEAEEKAQEAAAHLYAAQAHQDEAQAELDAARRKLGAADVPAAERSLAAARATREAAERELRQADSDLAGVTARIDNLRRQEASLEELRASIRAIEQEVGDWSLLERALGRDGVQALEIDAAGPEVARLTNELLEACYGARFSISFETLREKKSARGEFSEAFDVRVYDKGHERPVEALSGGERVIASEAIGLAIGIYSARKSGVKWETGFRDETAGALDPDNAAQYVLMLRRARELSGAYQIIFVSHQPEVWGAADARLVVRNGWVSPEAACERAEVTA